MPTRSHRHVHRAPPRDTSPARARAKEALPELPPHPEEVSGRDYLIMLLHIAAEIEHSVMVAYLYAAYSLGGDETSKHARKVREWRDSILTVAREEMGHLLTVQNLLLLVGGPVSFEREDVPWSSPYVPFEFRLEPFSLESLARFVYAEMPLNPTLATDRDLCRTVLKLVRPGDAPPIGEVYERIVELVEDKEVISDCMFDRDSYKYQTTWDEWGRGYRPGTHKPYTKNPKVPPPYERKTRVIVARMGTRTEALQALKEVAGQGEAEHLRAGEKLEPSHFDRFAKIFREYQAILKKDPGWSPSRPVPVNPYAGEARHAQPNTTAIASKTSRAWASLFNIRYRMLLSLLTHAYRAPRSEPESMHSRRAAILARIFGEMYNLKAVAGILVRLPLGEPSETARAGPPFQMPYTLTPALSEANFWRMHLDLLGAASELVETLLPSENDELEGASADGARYLHALRQADRESRTWIEGVLTSIEGHGSEHA